MNKQKESTDVILERVDGNVKHIKGKIDTINKQITDHENRIRDNEKFKNKTVGALAVISIITSIVVLIVAAILTGG